MQRLRAEQSELQLRTMQLRREEERLARASDEVAANAAQRLRRLADAESRAEAELRQETAAGKAHAAVVGELEHQGRMTERLRGECNDEVCGAHPFYTLHFHGYTSSLEPLRPEPFCSPPVCVFVGAQSLLLPRSAAPQPALAAAAARERLAAPTASTSSRGAQVAAIRVSESLCARNGLVATILGTGSDGKRCNIHHAARRR